MTSDSQGSLKSAVCILMCAHTYTDTDIAHNLLTHAFALTHTTYTTPHRHTYTPIHIYTHSHVYVHTHIYTHSPHACTICDIHTDTDSMHAHVPTTHTYTHIQASESSVLIRALLPGHPGGRSHWPELRVERGLCFSVCSCPCPIKRSRMSSGL